MAIGHGAVTKIHTTGTWTVSAGSLLVAVVITWGGDNTLHTAAGSTNGTFTRIGGSNGNSTSISIHYKANATAGTETLSFGAGGGGYASAIFHEVTGAGTVAPFTAGEVGSLFWQNGTGTNPQTPSVTNSVPESIFFAALCNDLGGGTNTLTVDSTGSSPTGWALQDTTNSQELNASVYATGSVAHLVVSSSAATKHGWTTPNNGSGMVIAAFGGVATTPKSVTDTGSGLDEVILDGNPSPEDTGTGTDAISVLNTISLTDTGAGVDGVCVNRQDAEYGLFAFAGGHSDTMHYIVWTPDVLAESPVWHAVGSGLYPRELPGADAHHQWALNPYAPRDQVYGVHYDGPTGACQALYRCDDIRGSGAFVKLIGLDWLKAESGDDTLTSLRVELVSTSPAHAPGWVFCTVHGIKAGVYQFAWLMHSHDFGQTWQHVAAPFSNLIPAAGQVAPDGSIYVLYGAGVDYLIRSTDGGHAWTTVYNLTTFQGLFDLWAPKTGNDDGLILYRSAAYGGNGNKKSTDGGATWSDWGSLPFPDAYGAINGPSDAADTLFFYQGYAPGIYRTDDGATTWAQLPVPGTNPTVLYPVDSTTTLVGGGWGLAQPAFDWYFGTYDGVNGWVNRDGNFADIIGADYGTVRYCFIAGVYNVPHTDSDVADTGSADDAISIRVLLTIADDGTGLDDATVIATITLSDDGSGLDDLPGFERHTLVDDLGTGLDDILVRIERRLRGRIPSEQNRARMSGFQVVHDRNSSEGDHP